MDAATYELLLAVFLTIFGAGVVWGAVVISRRSDGRLERTKAALKQQLAAEPELPEPVPDWSERDSLLAVEPSAAVGGMADCTGRHRVPDELLRASTYWLSADRIARARVPGPRPESLSDFH